MGYQFILQALFLGFKLLPYIVLYKSARQLMLNKFNTGRPKIFIVFAIIV